METLKLKTGRILIQVQSTLFVNSFANNKIILKALRLIQSFVFTFYFGCKSMSVISVPNSYVFANSVQWMTLPRMITLN